MAKKAKSQDAAQPKREKFWYAEDVKDISVRLIPTYFPDLVECKVKYIFKEKCAKQAGKMIYGNVAKASPKLSFFLDGCDYIMEVGYDGWQELDNKQKEACIFHLLCCCWVDVDEETDEYVYRTKTPDVQEFAEVINRYGFWHSDLEKFGTIIREIKLPAPDVKVESKKVQAEVVVN